ncbi:MAG TPA: TPM domain-containing protein [Chitinophagaceae bacterium]|nr:TPM domain-containing protein [Chitinophagaceae bacterium]
MFSFLRRNKEFFTDDERQSIVEAVRSAEQRTSGEVRVFVESRCRYVNAIDRAVEIFENLQMQKTEQRNATLVYVAIKDRQLAVFGDEGIHQKVGNEYWANEVMKMINAFNRDNIAEGIRQCVLNIGEALALHFPYNRNTDKNELPDDIVFGK